MRSASRSWFPATEPNRRHSAALREHGADSLAAYKLPEALQLTETLPLTAMEKIDRRAWPGGEISCARALH